MHESILQGLACPACKSGLELRSCHGTNGTATEGFLLCKPCGILTPVSRGFPLFTEAQLDTGNLDDDWLSSKGNNWFQSEQYNQFLVEKAARNLRDSYAFFQPFNESSRALLALVEPLSQCLSPGDLILDTWCRTGWSGEWLAGLFPEQRIISLWEGNSNVLGYSGFQYWLPEDERTPNLSILFTHADRHLPLKTDAIKLVVGLDSLHRYSQDTFLAECLRVTDDDGVLFFPHIHLTNSQPEPFFERGCNQLSGDEWQYILDKQCATGNRKAYIFSEPELFSCGATFTLNSNPDTADYNGAALIAPKEWEGSEVSTLHGPNITIRDYLFVNPLLDINLHTASVRLALDKPGLQVSEMLTRHPVYHQRLEECVGETLSPTECEVIFHSLRCKDFQQICLDNKHTEPDLLLAANALYTREILFPAAVSPAMAGLQAYYSYLELPDRSANSFPDLWQSMAECYQQHPIMVDEDGVEYDFESIATMVNATGHWLQGTSGHGDNVLICSENCPELFILIWACWLTGRIVVPIDAQFSTDSIAEIIAETLPAACFCHKPIATEYFQFDSLATEEQVAGLFSDQISPFIELEKLTSYGGQPDDLAAILFTSGSTGKPKGVCLSQGSLLHSGQLLAQTFNWRKGGVLLSLGATHTMSGLRNPAAAALASGMSILVPATGMKHPLQIYGLLARHEVTHLSTVPSLLVSLEKMIKSLASERRPESLEQIISTGYSLPAATKARIEEFLGIPVYGYYGLTETGGICLADSTSVIAQGSLGFPAGAIAQVRDKSGKVLGPDKPGELCIYSLASSSGYFGSNIASSVRFCDGWVYTGDIVKLAVDGSFDYVGRGDDQVKDRWGETLYLQEVENAASELQIIADCCCAIEGGKDNELDTLILFAVGSDQIDTNELSFSNEIYAQLSSKLGARKLPGKIVCVAAIERFASGKSDRASMLELSS